MPSSKFMQLVPAPLARRLNGSSGVVLFGSAARIFALASQFIVLLVMSWMLPKSEFGNAMIAFTLYRLLSTAIGTGFGNVLLHHVSRAGGDATLDLRLLKTTAFLSSAAILIVILPIATWSSTVAALFQKPDLAPWLVHMSPLALFGTLNLVTAASLDARSKITTSIFVTEALPNVFRLMGFLLLALLNSPQLAVAWVLWIALALPCAIDLVRIARGNGSGFAPFTPQDVKNAGSMTVYSLAALQLQGIDMIVVGLLFPSNVAADYAIASRIASLFPFFMQLAVRSFAPRAGRLLFEKDVAGLKKELDATQRWSVHSNLMTTAVILAASPLLLTAFGEYQNALPILCLLALPPIYRSFYAGADRLLQLAGYPHVSTAIMLVAFVMVTCLPFAFAPLVGPLAVPLAMIVSGTILNPVIAIYLKRSAGIASLEVTVVTKSLLTVLVGIGIVAIVPSSYAPYVLAAAFATFALLLSSSHTRLEK